MKAIVDEYGKSIIYFLIAVFLIGCIYYALARSNSVISNDELNNVGNNEVLVSTNNPIMIVASSVITKDSTFNAMSYVSAKDSNGTNITANVEVFGTVDTSKKGLYDIRYTVRDNLGLFSEKKVTFVVD